MTKETIQNYTRRISEANRSEIIVCVYEIAEIYLEDAIESHRNGDMSSFRSNCMKAGNCISDLLDALNFEYELAQPLMQIYLFMAREISLSSVREDVEMIKRIQAMVTKLKVSFEEVAKADSSDAVMENTQSVYAGLTYGRTSINESVTGDPNRGFKV